MLKQFVLNIHKISNSPEPYPFSAERARLTEYTENVYPTKMNEYLAMGKPVVSTPLHEVRLFNEQHGEIVAVGANSAEFGRRIEEALSENGEQQTRRVAVARENSWSSRIEQMSRLKLTHLRPHQRARQASDSLSE